MKFLNQPGVELIDPYKYDDIVLFRIMIPIYY